MTTYWLYIDDATNRLRVHEGLCIHCNHGEGIKGTRLSDNRWMGPFVTADDAVDESKRIGKRDTAGCGKCLPALRID